MDIYFPSGSVAHPDSEQPDVIIVLNKPTIALVYNSVFQRSETHKYTI